MKFRELERLVLADGWKFRRCVGSHRQYVHPIKKGKVTIPIHKGNYPIGLINSVLK